MDLKEQAKSTHMDLKMFGRIVVIWQLQNVCIVGLDHCVVQLDPKTTNSLIANKVTNETHRLNKGKRKKIII